MVKIRKATMKDLNDIVKIESDAFHMSKEMTEKDMIGRIKNYPDTFLVLKKKGKSLLMFLDQLLRNVTLKISFILKTTPIKKGMHTKLF
ncbi:MAG: Hypothetical protein LKU_01180 [Lactobacillus kefiranofaciens]|uniref:Acetyltransferase n=1 Tax=Lactobacillus kefiranofaciens TaxID=267818 RepID=A0ABY0MAM0_9LACO|nr:hypothetical protein FC93_GL000255 [Lactobacillus kefiranofaciens subsp. kefiranofaciens DSM 5016 = JCM 6985]SDA48205.1 hypothetical protein SAMN02983011_00816 [Lactobacillus kefiranofaciens]